MQDPIQRHPTRAEQLDILTTLIADRTHPGNAVLDVGCGTGYLGYLLAQRRPDLRFVGVDLAAEALAAAAENLSGFDQPPQLVEGDLTAIASIHLPVDRFRAIWTALTFHDLTDAEKRDVIGWMASMLQPGGFIYIYDRVRLEEPTLFAVQQSVWNRIERVHGTAMRSAGSFADYEADLGAKNRPATLRDYFQWLPAAGLTCQLVHLHGNVMLMAASHARGSA